MVRTGSWALDAGRCCSEPEGWRFPCVLQSPLQDGHCPRSLVPRPQLPGHPERRGSALPLLSEPLKAPRPRQQHLGCSGPGGRGPHRGHRALEVVRVAGGRVVPRSVTAGGARREGGTKRRFVDTATRRAWKGPVCRRLESVHGWDLFIINILIAFMQIRTLKVFENCSFEWKFNHRLCHLIFTAKQSSCFLY